MEKDKIPTAWDYCIENLYIDNEKQHIESAQALIKFAQMHVKKALEAASEKAELDLFNGGCHEYGSNKINKESILNSYSLNNIK